MPGFGDELNNLVIRPGSLQKMRRGASLLFRFVLVGATFKNPISLIRGIQRTRYFDNL